MAKKQAVTGMTMKISEMKDVIRLCMKADPKIPVFVHGAPGVGKSDAIRQLGEESGRPVIDLRMSLLNPVDLRGVPVAKDGQTAWWAPSFLPRKDDKTKDAILFLDEMNAAPPAVQAAAYQLVLDRRVGEYELPDGVDVIAAGNRGTDRAIVYDMSSALRNRFAHYEVDVDLDDWKDWALNNGVREEVISFLNLKPDRLFFFDSKVHVRQFPTPRSWAFASRLLEQVSSIRGTAPLFAGILGDGTATEFIGFLKVAGSIPNAEDIIIKGNMNIKAPTEASQLYAFSGALVGVATRAKDPMAAGKNLSAYCGSGALKADFSVLTCKDYARTDVFSKIYNKLILTKEWKQFSDKWGELVVH
jgi:hypothetical protein